VALNKLIFGALLVWLMVMGNVPMTLVHAASEPSDILVVSGTITNDQEKPLKEVRLQFFLNGKKVHIEEDVTASKSGR
jgi:hypothetical protein